MDFNIVYERGVSESVIAEILECSYIDKNKELYSMVIILEEPDFYRTSAVFRIQRLGEQAQP